MRPRDVTLVFSCIVAPGTVPCARQRALNRRGLFSGCTFQTPRTTRPLQLRGPVALLRLRSVCSAARQAQSVLFFGTDQFALTSLKALLKERDAGGAVKYLEVITPPDGPSWTRSSTVPVKAFAVENNLTVRHPPPKTLQGWRVPAPADSAVPRFDVAVVVSFGYFLTRTVLSAFNGGTLNVHPSLLPKYRGGAPIHHVIMNGEAKTGVSIIDLHPQKFDAGRILRQVEVPIEGKPFLEALSKNLSEIGAGMLVDTLRNLPAYQAAAITQDEALVTRANRLTRTYAEADFDRLTAEQLYARHRALSHEFPLVAHIPRKRGTSVFLTEIDDPETIAPSLPIPADAPPGTFVYDPVHDALFVRCVDGAHLPVRRLRVALSHRNEVGAEEWFRGYGDRWRRFLSLAQDSGGSSSTLRR